MTRKQKKMLIRILITAALVIILVLLPIKEIWGGYLETDIVSLRVHMATLRKKIGDTTRKEPLIETHVGIGYSMVKY